MIAGPDIITRGFVYVRESEELLEEAKQRVGAALKRCEEQNTKEWSVIKNNVKDALGKFLFDQTHRNPMILPIIMEI